MWTRQSWWALCGRFVQDVLWTHLWQCFALKKIWHVTSSMPERVPRGTVSLYHRALSSVVWGVAIIPLYRCHPSKIVSAGRVGWAGCEGTQMLAGVPLLNLPPLARSVSQAGLHGRVGQPYLRGSQYVRSWMFSAN